MAADFDPQRHIDFDELQVGMKGYGLTVFEGTQVERFDVEIVSLLEQAGIKRKAIMIRCLDDRFDKAKVVQGVSGSPVFFDDRIAGAMAFGYAYSVEPLYGVTPIREMLNVARSARPHEGMPPSATSSFTLEPSDYINLTREKLTSPEFLKSIWLKTHLVSPTTVSDQSNGLLRMPLSIIAGGIQPQMLESLRQLCPDLQWNWELSGGDAANSRAAGSGVQLEPGGVLAMPLVRGDASMAVVGTVTDVIGNEVYGFGHPWLGVGDSWWPLATGTIHQFVSLQTISRKIGSPLEIVGAIRGDEAAGIFGQIGETVKFIPITVTVSWPYLDTSESFHFELVRDDLYTAVLGSLVTANCLLYRGILPNEHTVRYKAEMKFTDLDPIQFGNISAGHQNTDVLLDLQQVLIMMLNNPWQSASLESLHFEAVIDNVDNVYTVKNVDIQETIYHPGQTVEAKVTLEPRRRGSIEMPISVRIPDDAPDGQYKLEVGSFLHYQRQLQRTAPHLFQAYDAASAARALEKLMSVPRNGLYMVLPMKPQGMAVEGRPLPNLPKSRQMLLSDDKRATTISPIHDMIYTRLETDFVVMGGSIFEIQVERE